MGSIKIEVLFRVKIAILKQYFDIPFAIYDAKLIILLFLNNILP